MLLPTPNVVAAALTAPGMTRIGETFLAAVSTYLLLVALGRLLKYRFGTRLGAIYQMFCVATGPFLAVSLLEPEVPGRRELGAVAALLGTGVAARLVDQYFWRWYFEKQRKAPVPKFIRELAAGLLLLIVLVVILQRGYHADISGFLKVSGVVGIILGFAMQDSLGNIIAGFALQFGRPFQVGDWLLVDNQHVQAVEINWRSTRFVTTDEVQLDVPNQQLVRQTITNFHGGGAVHAVRLEIGIDYDVPPNRVKDLLGRAAESAPGVRTEPAPMVIVKNFGDSAVIYEVKFWLSDHRTYNPTSDAVRTNIWYALHRHQVRIPFPIRTLQVERTPAPAHQADRREARRKTVFELLRQQPVFATMSEGQVRVLVDHCPTQHYGRGEIIIREGAQGASMFVLVQGEAGVTVRPDENPTWVATLRGGDCFGELSLLTGEKRSANVVASLDCEVLEIAKAVFADIVNQDPAILTRLSELLARRQLETEGIVAAHAQRSATTEDRVQEYQAGFLARLKSFFEL